MSLSGLSRIQVFHFLMKCILATISPSFRFYDVTQVLYCGIKRFRNVFYIKYNFKTLFVTDFCIIINSVFILESKRVSTNESPLTLKEVDNQLSLGLL